MLRERVMPLSGPMPLRATSRMRILDEFGRPIRCSEFRPRPSMRGTYDVVQDDNQLKEVWAQATGRSADAEASPAVRATARNRARYELRNNSYLRAMVDTRALYVVGRLPRLQLDTSDAGGSEDYDRAKERSYKAWCDEVRLGQKLRLSEILMAQDGEAFLAFVHNPRLRHSVKLDVLVIETDRVTGQLDKLRRRWYYDGIEYDQIGNPLSYDILDEHPGGSGFLTGFTGAAYGAYTNKSADQVIHRYRATRSQKRGFPEVAPALRLGAMLRRYTLAVLTAAENVASFSWLLYSDHPQITPLDIDPMDAVSLEYGSGLTLPAGWKMAQMQAQQPAATYREFKREVLTEMGRCLYEPQNIALGDSSAYNYSSGRLDFQAFFKWIDSAQYDLGLDSTTIYARWNDYYQFTPRALRMKGWRPGDVEPHRWHFDGIEHVDPYKEAMAQQLRLANRTTSLAIEWARQGLSAEEGLRQLARDQKLLRELELVPEPGSAPRNGEGSVKAAGWMMAERIAGAIADRVDPERIAEALAALAGR